MRMKKFYILFFFILSIHFAKATLIVADGLNNSSALFTIAGGAYYTGNSVAGDRPATSPFASEGTHSYGANNTSAVLTSSDINTNGYASISMTFRVAAFSIGSAGNGMDAADLVKVEVSPDGGTTWWNTLVINGNSNCYWSYTATGNASTAYDGNNTPVAYAPAGGGSRTADGYSTATITSLPAISNLQFRITLLNNAGAEQWVIDDFQVNGTLTCSPPANPTGSITVSANPSCGPATLSFPTGSGAVVNYWQTSSSGTSTTYRTSTNYSLAATGTIYVRAYDTIATCWSLSSINTGAVTINNPVAITTQPTNQTVTVGNTATFSVAATGSGLNYQWQENQGVGWNNIGGNSTGYTTPATTALMNGWQYQCIVSGTAPCSSAISSTATLTVTVPLSAGFDVSSGSVIENAGTYQIGVTVNAAPASNLVLRVADAGTGTASPVTDFTYTTTNLTFLTVGSYPQTQYATVTILNDVIPESNKYRNFILTRISGPAVTPSPAIHQMTIIDDDVLEGVVINEFSQGVNNASYVELVVIGIPGTTVDLRGWIIDDNSGIFSGGYGSQLGIADGHVKFSNICSWEKVPVGSIIVIYANDQTGTLPVKNNKITNLGLVDDPTDANLDYVYVVGVNFYNTGQCATATVNDYFSSDCNLPSNSSYDVYTPATYVNPDFGTAQFRNSGDAVQLRDPVGTYFMGLSYGDKGAGSSCAGCDINAANHPDYATYGSNALYFSGTTNKTYAFINTNDNDYRKLNNWTKTTSVSPNALETPSTWNSTNNQTWILSLRGNFDVVLDDQNYTCQLREFESRYYLDAIDKIIFYIKNNANIDHGDFTAETILHDDATAGLGFQNSNLTGTPLFMTKTWAATPTNYSSPNYKIKFFVSTQELQNYCDYINPILNALPGYYTAHNHTPAEVISHLKIYKTATTDRAWTVTTDVQVEIKIPVTGTYTSATGVIYTTFEYDGFTGFSGYALGDVVTPDIGLPVELTYFNAKCKDDAVTLNWTTASEKNSAYFEVERSSDAIHFTAINRIVTAQKSNQIKNYQFIDEYHLNGINYYRLKQQDNGNTAATYSNIVQTECNNASVNSIQAYYNAFNEIVININSETDKELVFKVYEISGKLLYQENKKTNAGNSVFSLSLKQQLADGIYIVQTIDDQEISSTKIWVH